MLVSALEGALRVAGFNLEDRAWRPHISLLREARRPETLPEMALQWPVREFVLVESAVGAYHVIGHWNLAAI
jgi:2'-5' RNA ligase